MAKLMWSSQALADLDAACEFISRDSPKYAYLFAQHIVALIETIPQHPMLGAVVSEYGREDLRERLFQNYRIVYRVRKDGVEIVTLVHGARLMPHLPPTGS
jgi:toxin ParE1/3/4